MKNIKKYDFWNLRIKNLNILKNNEKNNEYTR